MEISTCFSQYLKYVTVFFFCCHWVTMGRTCRLFHTRASMGSSMANIYLSYNCFFLICEQPKSDYVNVLHYSKDGAFVGFIAVCSSALNAVIAFVDSSSNLNLYV